MLAFSLHLSVFLSATRYNSLSYSLLFSLTIYMFKYLLSIRLGHRRAARPDGPHHRSTGAGGQHRSAPVEQGGGVGVCVWHCNRHSFVVVVVCSCPQTARKKGRTTLTLYFPSIIFHFRKLFVLVFHQEPYKQLKYPSGVMFTTYTSLVASKSGGGGGGVRSRLDQLVRPRRTRQDANGLRIDTC